MIIIWLVSGGNCEASLGKEPGLILGIFNPPNSPYARS